MPPIVSDSIFTNFHFSSARLTWALSTLGVCMIDNTYPELVYSALRIAPVIVIVAVLAHANKNRLIFWLGLAGCFLGLLFDRGGSTGGLLDHASVRAGGFLFMGIIGASIGCIIAWLLKTRVQLEKQYSILGLIVTTTLVAIALAVYNSL